MGCAPLCGANGQAGSMYRCQGEVFSVETEVRSSFGGKRQSLAPKCVKNEYAATRGKGHRY